MLRHAPAVYVMLRHAFTTCIVYVMLRHTLTARTVHVIYVCCTMLQHAKSTVQNVTSVALAALPLKIACNLWL